jgi:hypothetical protein
MQATNMLYQLADLLKDSADKRVENVQLKEKIKQLEKRNDELMKLLDASEKIRQELILKYID